MSWPAPDVAMKAYTDRLRCTISLTLPRLQARLKALKQLCSLPLLRGNLKVVQHCSQPPAGGRYAGKAV